MSWTKANIINIQGKNSGGVPIIYVQHAAAIVSMPTPVALGISDNIEGGQFANIGITPESGDWNERQRENKQGASWEASFTCRVAKDNNATSWQLSNYTNKNLVTVVTDNNGVTRILGTPEAPARLTYQLIKGEGHVGTNLYNVTIAYVGEEPPAYYAGTINALP